MPGKLTELQQFSATQAPTSHSCALTPRPFSLPVRSSSEFKVASFRIQRDLLFPRHFSYIIWWWWWWWWPCSTPGLSEDTFLPGMILLFLFLSCYLLQKGEKLKWIILGKQLLMIPITAPSNLATACRPAKSYKPKHLGTSWGRTLELWNKISADSFPDPIACQLPDSSRTEGESKERTSESSLQP